MTKYQPDKEIIQLIVARKKAKLTQWDIARRTGTTAPAISRFESGQHSPSLRTYRAIAEAIGLKVAISFIEEPKT